MTVTETIVNRLARSLGKRRTGRRSFLVGTAVVGSALVTHPVRYATRPMSAYASICGEAAACADGWSVFCCTINNGANSCPPGSFVGGWWKADHSGFCCGSARYYVDCNASCGSGWQCHCGPGSSCDQRRVACNQFRYGQCHQEISCHGPVVCRVVTCTPPWQFDKSCTATSITENRTVTHSAPCLPGNCPSALTRFYYDRGGPGGPYGKVTAPDRRTAAGLRILVTQQVLMMQLPGGTIHTMAGAILAKYRTLSGSNGVLGDVTGPVSVAGGVSTAPFQHGAIVSSSRGTFAVLTAIYTAWRAAGGAGTIGGPTEDRTGVAGGVRQLFTAGVGYDIRGAGRIVGPPYYALYRSLGLDAGVLGVPAGNAATGTGGLGYQVFARGRMYGRSRPAAAVYNPILAGWLRYGGGMGQLGYPTGTQVQYSTGRWGMSFDRGGLFVTPGHGAFPLLGVFWEKWRATAPIHGSIGLPTGARLSVRGGIRTPFEHGAMIYSSGYGAKAVYGPIWSGYLARGAEAGVLGLPRTDVYTSGTRQRCDFQHGSLVYDQATGRVTQV